MGRERLIMVKKQDFYPKQISPLCVPEGRFGRNDNAVAGWVWLVTLGVLVVGIANPTKTLAAGPYRIDWYTIDGGGGTSRSGQYVLTGTIGQPDADWSKGGKYELLGGFWPGGPLCVVEFDDFTRLAEQWLSTASGLAGDLDGDNDVDFDDLSWLADFWLCSCPVPWPLK
jgi:hypothetical protein